MGMRNEHRAPWDCVYAKDEDEGCEAGEAPGSDQGYFEVLSLCLIQAGLNWASIRKHWPRYKEGFLSFDIQRLARADADELLERPGVIRNRRKAEALIHNAKEFRSIEKEFGSFAAFLKTLKQLSEKERIKALSKRFKQVGPETAAYFLYAVGFSDSGN